MNSYACDLNRSQSPQPRQIALWLQVMGTLRWTVLVSVCLAQTTLSYAQPGSVTPSAEESPETQTPPDNRVPTPYPTTPPNNRVPTPYPTAPPAPDPVPQPVAPNPAPQPAPPPRYVPPYAPTPLPQQPPPSALSKGIVNDAASAGLWVSPTALMPPAGSFTIENNVLLISGGSYAFTDTFSLSAHAFYFPLIPVIPFVLSVKMSLVNDGRLRLALTGSVLGLNAENKNNLGAFGVGGIATYCIDAHCNSFLNGNVEVLGLIDFEENTKALPIVLSVGLSQRLSSGIKAVLEINGGGALGDVTLSKGALFWYGLRFLGSSKYAVNAGFIKPLLDNINEYPLGVPWFSFVYRGGI